MCRTGMWRIGVGYWIFLFACLHLFTYAEGGDDQVDPGVRFTVEPSDAVVVPGESTLLPCAASARRPVRLSWRHSAEAAPTRDHAISDNDKNRKQVHNGSLTIEEMSAALAGHYQCVATVDAVGTILSRVATVFLAEVPEVVGGARSVLGVAGGGALLACGVRAPPRVALRLGPAPPDRRVYGAARAHHPPPLLKLNVTWLKNGSPMRVEGARMALTASGALEIEPLRAHDAARYACRVALLGAHPLYKVSEETELRVSAEAPNVESPPRFIVTPQPLTVLEGASVTFDCAAVGNPKPEITWLNNGAAIDLSDLDSRFYLVGAGSLRVQWARALDAGAYTCRAHSRLDSADHTTQLHVLTAPRAQAAGGAVARARGGVTLRCEVRGRPAPRVRWLKDGDPLTPNNQDIALLDGTSLRIQGVLRVDAGMFQCMASSAAGSATASVRLVVLPPDDDIISNTSIPTPPTTHDILNTLTSQPDSSLDLPEDFLGETSSAYTSGPEFDYEAYDNDLLHAAKGLDSEAKANASVVSAPRGLKAVIVKHTFVTLSWEEPELKAEQISGYTVIYRVKGSDRERVARGVPQKHEMNVASLQPNTTYEFSVAAYTEHAVSPASDTIEVQTAEEEMTHGPPQNLHVEALGPHALRVLWAPPRARAPSAPAPTKYTIQYTEAETGRDQFQWLDTDSGSTSLFTTLGGLRAGAAYVVRVSAAGGAAAEARAATPSDAPAAPPANVSAAATSATSILVRWDAPPARTHRGALTGYKVRYRALPPPAAAGAPSPAPARRKADSLTTPADARRAELRGLDTATTYQVRVCAINANGSGPFSEWVSASTQRRQLDEDRVPPQPPPLTTRAGRDWISVWWSEDGGAAGGGGVVVRGYVLGWGLGVPDDTSRELPPHLHSHVIRGLESNSEYVISLRASNSRGLGPAVYATVRTKPAADHAELDDDEEPDDEEPDEEDELPPLIPPVGVKVIMLSGTTAVVYWTDPTLPRGQAATDGRRYVVRWAGAGGRARTYNATDLNCMLDELRPHTQYEFAVKLIKGGRESAWSMLVTNTTLEAAPGSAPRDLRAAPAPPPASPARAVDLSWAPPARPNGVITGYVIMYALQRAGGAEEWTAVAAVGERTRARVERLRARTTYLFKIQARNSRGLGPFCAPLAYATAAESGEGGGLAHATSAWLWASAGGACAVLALAAALALSLCCRRAHPPLSPDTSTYQKSSASAGIKPPDLWIHHDQMELKHMDKSLHSSAMSGGSADGGAALVSSTLTLGRAPGPPHAEYEPARHPPPASLDRRHYVPTYVESRSSSAAGSGSDDTAVLRASPPCRRCDRCDHCDYSTRREGTPSTVALPIGHAAAPTASDAAARHAAHAFGTMTGVGSSCASTCERRRLPHPDQSTPLLAGVAPLGSPPGALPAHAHHAHPHAAHTHLGTCAGAPPAADLYAAAARERGHYVAYEPLGHYTHREAAGGEAPAGGGSLPRRAACPAQPLHSFALDAASDRSTPTHSHSRGSVRDTSPYKKSASSSPGHIPNRLQLGGGVSHCAEELEPLTPSRSTERLHREMQNLEGLMKDLSAITQQQFHC